MITSGFQLPQIAWERSIVLQNTFTGFMNITLIQATPLWVNDSKSCWKLWFHNLTLNLTLKAHANGRNKSQHCWGFLSNNVASVCMGLKLERIQHLVRGGSDKRPLTLSSCYCYLTSPFFTRKIWSKYLHLFHFGGFDRTTPGSAPA